VVYTLWVRFMQVLSMNKDLSATWAKPVELPFFQNDKDYLDRFKSFSIASKLMTEENIKTYGNDCGADRPVIRYDQCSSHFTDLWRQSARSMQAHVRKKGPAIIPSKAALMWPGLSLSQFLSSSIPAWSSNKRDLNQVVLLLPGTLVAATTSSLLLVIAGLWQVGV
jgi:hypothetical protein